jgi:uncharacterized protein YjbI with pentapeptide repeats
MFLRPARSERDLKRRLLLANPWLEPFLALSRPEIDPNFAPTRRDSCRRRLRAGVSAWQDWAAEMGDLARGAAATSFAVALAAASVSDFAGAVFDAPADVAGLSFPGTTLFGQARFSREAYFNACVFHGIADFRGAKFSDAWFENATFLGRGDFADTDWSGAAEFRASRFGEQANFSRASFGADLWCCDANFEGPVDFEDARFAGETGFGDAQFEARAGFVSARFHGNAGFRGVRFAAEASFARAVFHRKAWFGGSSFAGAALFHRARFLSGADFDGVQFAAGAADPSEFFEMARRAEI